MIVTGGFIGLAIALFLAFGVFGIHKAFVDDVVAEDNPFETTASSDELDNQSQTSTSTETFTEPEDSTTPEEQTTVTEQETTAARTEATAQFTGLGSYDGSGTANIISDGSKRFLRFEDDFKSDNGPDLKVYLRADDGEIINLGELKGNIGSQNYEVDLNVNLDKFNTVEIWCERFSVGFAEAPLT